jgi:UDP-glucose 4-epimerase
MRVLVTGGAGFIGSHVADAFVAAGHEVWALDDLSTGRRENVGPGVRLVVADIRSPEAARLVESERFEVLCHLAAQMDVRRSVSDPRFDAEVNVGGFLNLLEAARRAGVRKVIFSSTGGAIYGEQDVFPAPESHPTRPVSPYGVSKAAGELYLGYYRAQYGLPRWRCATPTSTATPEPPWRSGVVAIFSERLLAGEPCTIFGTDGRPGTRLRPGRGEGKPPGRGTRSGRPINIGTGVRRTSTTLRAARPRRRLND